MYVSSNIEQYTPPVYDTTSCWKATYYNLQLLTVFKQQSWAHNDFEIGGLTTYPKGDIHFTFLITKFKKIKRILIFRLTKQHFIVSSWQRYFNFYARYIYMNSPALNGCHIYFRQLTRRKCCLKLSAFILSHPLSNQCKEHRSVFT